MKIISREASNTFPQTELWTVQPDSIDHSFLLYITRPEFSIPDEKLPCILVFDGNSTAGTVVNLAQNLGLPPSILVSIGYPLNSAMPPVLARNQDLTFSHWPAWDVTYGRVHNHVGPPSGQADRFLAFLTEELKPEIQRHFNTDPAEWTVAGHSHGGLFVTYALLTSPSLFKRYLAVGSAFWWNGSTVFDLVGEFNSSEEELDVSVYLAAGDGETQSRLAESMIELMKTDVGREYFEVMGTMPDIVEDTRRMADLISRRKGTKVVFHILDGESHGSALFAAYSRGLRWLSAAKD